LNPFQKPPSTKLKRYAVSIKQELDMFTNVDIAGEVEDITAYPGNRQVE
jgi:hypothetical protein